MVAWPLILFLTLAGCSSEQPTLKTASFVDQLTSDNRRDFEKLTPPEQQWVVQLTNKHTPDQALWAAADFDVKTLSEGEVQLYAKLSPQDRVLFLIVNADHSADAGRWFLAGMSAHDAIMKALKLDIDQMSDAEKAYLTTLTFQQQLVYLTLSDALQVQLAATHGDLNAALEKDASRLHEDELALYRTLPEDERMLLLVLTPDARGMAVALTEGIDPNAAMGYYLTLVYGDAQT